MINTAVIESKIESGIGLLEKLKDILKEHSVSKTLQEYLLYAAEKKAEEIVELAISINQELLKEKGKVALSYYESFSNLTFLGFKEAELKELSSTAGFRNRLAHEYLEINPEIALRSMQKIIKIYPTYFKKIKSILK